jgi:hypothetical protein
LTSFQLPATPFLVLRVTEKLPTATSKGLQSFDIDENQAQSPTAVELHRPRAFPGLLCKYT